MKKPRCNKCNSTQIYHTKKNVVCQKCGHKEERKEKKDDQDYTELYDD